jgi:hypothetical protein
MFYPPVPLLLSLEEEGEEVWRAVLLEEESESALESGGLEVQD